jgi:hypothetical protein
VKIEPKKHRSANTRMTTTVDWQRSERTEGLEQRDELATLYIFVHKHMKGKSCESQI